MFQLDYSYRANQFLKKLDKHIAKRIIDKLENLKQNSVPSNVKFIHRENNEMVFRYRIGDYRALYKVKKDEEIILITKIDKRPKVYK
ncbi:type II toxin-antitoxin system mRNA interferase toxin, RelE/StbE family [archaeon]|nr:type II toxin-antitoxin system mRNA interferase toxin, RelE/StbE family [archaeon]